MPSTSTTLPSTQTRETRTRTESRTLRRGRSCMSWLSRAGRGPREIAPPKCRAADPAMALQLTIDHARPADVSVRLAGIDGIQRVTQLLWDPGFHERGVVILSPAEGGGGAGVVHVRGGASGYLPGGGA